jgi:hypothetical protein
VQIPISFDPIELAVDPDTKPKLMPIGMIFLSDKGIVNIPQTIILIKGNQQCSVSYRQITGHIGSTSLKSIDEGNNIQQVIKRHLRKHRPFKNSPLRRFLPVFSHLGPNLVTRRKHLNCRIT